MTVRYVDDRIHDSTLHWCQFWNHNETFTRSRTINLENVQEITVRNGLEMGVVGCSCSPPNTQEGHVPYLPFTALLLYNCGW